MSIFLQKDALFEFLARIVAKKINVEVDRSRHNFSQDYNVWFE